MREEDISRVTELAEELGYASREELVLRRFYSLSSHKEHSIVVFEDGNKILGWMHLKQEYTLLGERKVEIAALVVDEKYRSRGVGKLFVDFSKYWAKINGSNTISVRTSILRERAHAFYQREGFQLRKTSHFFTLKI
jgi:GNAT superfamily N-acetyltransferase